MPLWSNAHETEIGSSPSGAWRSPNQTPSVPAPQAHSPGCSHTSSTGRQHQEQKSGGPCPATNPVPKPSSPPCPPLCPGCTQPPIPCSVPHLPSAPPSVPHCSPGVGAALSFPGWGRAAPWALYPPLSLPRWVLGVGGGRSTVLSPLLTRGEGAKATQSCSLLPSENSFRWDGERELFLQQL